MKTRYILAALLCTAAISCGREDRPSGDIGLVTLEASIGTPGTRIHFTGETELATIASWEADDRIWVRSDTQPYWERGECFATSASAITGEGHSASFTGRTRTDGRLAAVYPFGVVEDGSDNDHILMEVPRSRTLAVDDCPAGAIYAAAFWADGTDRFSMNYLVGAVKFSLKGSGEKVKRFELVDADASKALWGRLEIEPDYEQKGIASVNMTCESESRNSIFLDADLTLGETAVSFYFVLPEGALKSGFSLKAYGEGGAVVASVSSDKDNSVVRGQVVRMPEAAL